MKLKLITLATLLTSFVNSLVLDESLYKFLNFKTKYNKKYLNNDIQKRYGIFQENLRKIEKHNSENHGWTMNLNQFTDLTADEFKKTTSCFKDINTPLYNNTSRIRNLVNLPTSVDWTTKGAVTEVKNQGQCGSCWAFSTTGSVEGAYFLKYGKLVDLSEQQLVDCSSSYGNEGCNGGLMDNAFNYIKDKGICLENEYPYKETSQKCKSCETVLKIDSFVDVSPNSETALQQAVAIQPVSVAIEADKSVFQFYSGGVMSSKCGSNLDHGVLVVGYGTLNGKDFWKVKNSWGPGWGDSGYILLERNIQDSKGQCGIAMIPSYPIIH